MGRCAWLGKSVCMGGGINLELIAQTGNSGTLDPMALDDGGFFLRG